MSNKLSPEKLTEKEAVALKFMETVEQFREILYNRTSTTVYAIILILCSLYISTLWNWLFLPEFDKIDRQAESVVSLLWFPGQKELYQNWSQSINQIFSSSGDNLAVIIVGIVTLLLYVTAALLLFEIIFGLTFTFIVAVNLDSGSWGKVFIDFAPITWKKMGQRIIAYAYGLVFFSLGQVFLYLLLK